MSNDEQVPEERLKEETEKESISPQEDKNKITGKDKKAIIAWSVVAIGFSIRGGEFPGSVFATLLQIVSCFIYGFGMVFLFIGLTKKTFKYNPTKAQIIRWAVTLAAIFAFSEMLHEGYLILTHQLPAK
jgi:hypothetical protein